MATSPITTKPVSVIQEDGNVSVTIMFKSRPEMVKEIRKIGIFFHLDKKWFLGLHCGALLDFLGFGVKIEVAPQSLSHHASVDLQLFGI